MMKILPAVKKPLPYGRGSDWRNRNSNQSRDREGAVAGPASIFEEAPPRASERSSDDAQAQKKGEPEGSPVFQTVPGSS
jgi:hypothetical protein